MKENTNTQQTPAGHPSQIEQSATATKPKKFEVALAFTQYSKATVVIEAVSLEEAEEKAHDIAPDDIDDWDAFDGEIDVIDVSDIEGENSHD